MDVLKTKKYENAILYLCSKQNDRAIHGKKKLAKLLYYVDFDRFEFNESMETVTGDSYKRLPMGPVPSAMGDITTEMSREGLLAVEERQEYADFGKTTVYEAKADPDMTVFSPHDVAILGRVARKYLGLTGKQLEELSHTEAPWLAVDPYDTIPFELAFYRDTDFSDAK